VPFNAEWLMLEFKIAPSHFMEIRIMKQEIEYLSIIIVFGVIFLSLSMCYSDGKNDNKVKVDRSALSYYDSGLYTSCEFVHGPDTPEGDGIENLLTLKRASSKESPWSFYIMQYGERLKTLSDEDQKSAKKKYAKTFRQMASNGKKVILRCKLGKQSDRAPSVDEMEKQIEWLLDGLDIDCIYAITLDEERVYWNGWTSALTELYFRVKKRWPELLVYQWWTLMEVPDVKAKNGWIALPADGWIIDLYGQPREEFEKKLVKALETGKPVIDIVWSSPSWHTCGGTEPCELGVDKSPDKIGCEIQVFKDQLEICRGYNVPVAHFCVQPPVKNDKGEKISGFLWGWQATDRVLRDWYKTIEKIAEENRKIPTEEIGFRSLDKAKFEWSHSKWPMVKSIVSEAK